MAMVPNHPALLRAVEETLGRPLDARPPSTIGDLNQVPPELVDEARRLPRSLRRDFIAYHVASSQHSWVRLFTQQVVDGGQDPASWLRGAVLHPDWSVVELATLDVAVLIAPLGELPDGARARIASSRAGWEAG